MADQRCDVTPSIEVPLISHRRVWALYSAGSMWEFSHTKSPGILYGQARNLYGGKYKVIRNVRPGKESVRRKVQSDQECTARQGICTAEVQRDQEFCTARQEILWWWNGVCTAQIQICMHITVDMCMVVNIVIVLGFSVY
jgi:hypothetical protein